MYTTSTVANIYKRIWPEGIEHLVLAESPILATLPKMNRFFGSGKELAWRVGNGGQVSADLTVAQARTSQPTINKPYVTRKKLYITKELDHEAMEASENDSGALIDLVEEATTNAMDELKRAAGQLIFGNIYQANPTGCIGRISTTSNVATATITLADITMIRNFYAGQTLQAYNTVGAGLLNAGAVVTISAVDEEAGTITATGNWTAGIAALAAGDYLVSQGNFNAVPAGFFAWNPKTLIAVGGGDSFFTVDRGGSVAMQGSRYAPSTGSIDEVVIQALHLHANAGGKHDMVAMNPIDLGNLIQQANTLQRINENAIGSNGKKIANLSFEAVRLNGPLGPVSVLGDPYMPRREFQIYNRSTVEIWSLKEMFRLLTKGSNAEGMVRESDADASEMRFGGYWNFVCKRPRDLLHGTLPA